MGYEVFATCRLVSSDSGKLVPVSNYFKEDRPWGNEWEISLAVDLALSMRGINTGGSMPGSISVGLLKGMQSTQLLRIICQHFHLLALDGEGKLRMSTQDSGILMDTASHKVFYFSGDSINGELKRMLKHMVGTELNKSGPLIDMIYALSDWYARWEPGTYDISFDFTW